MSILKTPVTRDMEVRYTKDGKSYFTISEAGKEVYSSDAFEDPSECVEEGIAMMNALHEEAPLRDDYLPGN